MFIRLTKPEELDKVMEIYARAREFMREQGNPTQWGSTEPKRERVAQDIAESHSFVCCEGEELLGVFSFEAEADDPTYHEIWDGNWPETDSYGVLHRIAVGTPGRGVAGFCLDWCWARCRQLRADTHADNLPMQRAMIKNGFARCGMIKTYNGTDRIAFARPAKLWIAQNEKKRRQLLAASLGLYALAILLAVGLLADVMIRTGSGWLLLPIFALLALPGCLMIFSRLKKGGGIELGPEGIENRLAERVLHGSYAWAELSGAEFGPKEKTIELMPRDPDAFFAALPRRTRKALRQKRLRNDTLPLSCLLLTKQDKERLLHLIRINLDARKDTKE